MNYAMEYVRRFFMPPGRLFDVLVTYPFPVLQVLSGG